MTVLRYCTLTGAGETTSLSDMAALSRKYPFLEWAILYAPTRSGKENRYPSLQWITEFVEFATKRKMNIALHLCGDAVKQVLQHFSPEGARSPELIELMQKFDRVQLNRVFKLADVTQIRRAAEFLIRDESPTRTVLQWNMKNLDVCRQLCSDRGIDMLVDSSGGRGIERTDWPRAADPSLGLRGNKTAYSGGLGLDNLREQLPRIRDAAAGYMFSVDMEGKIRTADDELDMPACTTVLKVLQEFLVDELNAIGRLHGTGTFAVQSLPDFWLNYWVAATQIGNLVVPPKDASRVMAFWREEGDFYGYDPVGDANLAKRILTKERIAFIPLNATTWRAYKVDKAGAAVPGTEQRDKDMLKAGLRAVVAALYGSTVPKNPALAVL